MKQTSGLINTNGIKGFLLWCGLLLCGILSSSQLLAQQSVTIANGGTYSGFTFPVTGCVYNWVNDNPSIGLHASGTSDIPSFIGKNNGTAPNKANITITTIAQNANGYIIGDNTVAVLDMAKQQVTKELPIQGVGMGIGTSVFSPDGTLLYVFNYTQPNSHIDIVNTITNTITGSIPIDFVFSMFISLDGKYLYLPNRARGLVIVSTESKSEIAQIDMGPGYATPLAALSLDGKTLYAAKNNTIFVINTATNTVSKTYVLPFFSAMTMSPDGTKLFATGNNYLYVIDPASGSFNSIPVDSQLSGAPLVHPKGNFVYFTDASQTLMNKVYFVDINANTSTSIDVSQNYFYLVLSDDGNTLYATEIGSGNVTVISTITKQITARIAVNAANFDEQSFSQGAIDHGSNRFYVTSNVQVRTIGGTDRSFITVINTTDNSITRTIPLANPAYVLVNSNAGALCNTPAKTFTITVEPDPPVINTSGSPSRLTTTYGSPSSATTISVSGARIGTGISITAPPGFEVSADGITFSDNIKIGTTETIPPSWVFIRLKATVSVAAYLGNIVLTAGNTTVNVPMPLSNVVQAPLLITAGNVTKIYGEKLTDGPRFTNFTAVGLKNGDKIGTVTVTYGPGSAPADGVKTYTGSVNIYNPTDGNFDIANYFLGRSAAGNITVSPAPLTITADDKQRYYTDPNPPLTFTYSGFVNNETETQLTTAPVITTVATIASPVGFYPITPSGAVAANYTFNYKSGTLNILPKEITPTTAFTPNGDGVNDTWAIRSIAQYPNCLIEVMDRYGAKVYQNTGYTVAWDGKYRGTALPTGTYYYIIKLNDTLKPLTGNLTIIR